MSDVFSEITPLSATDCFYVVDRYKDKFDYPIHRHIDFELTFVKGASGAVRVVGDSVEKIGDLDLALIGSSELEHAWTQGECKGKNIREITIQFHPDFFSGVQLEKNQFASIKQMLVAAENGISFPMDTILKVYAVLEELVAGNRGFSSVLTLMSLLNILSQNEYKVLSSSSFAHTSADNESRRVQKIKHYISQHYSSDITLADMASMVGMTPAAFSRFFRKRTGKTLIGYLLDIRIGAAARMLADTSKSVAEICYEVGFNNLSNFNRAFRKFKGMTPGDFRLLYKKHKTII